MSISWNLLLNFVRKASHFMQGIKPTDLSPKYMAGDNVWPFFTQYFNLRNHMRSVWSSVHYSVLTNRQHLRKNKDGEKFFHTLLSRSDLLMAPTLISLYSMLPLASDTLHTHHQLDSCTVTFPFNSHSTFSWTINLRI